MTKFTHFDEDGRARMADVSGKEPTVRTATARGRIQMRSETMLLINEGRLKKGDVLAVADVAAVMAAKNTPQLIPMCHPLLLSGVMVNFSQTDAPDGMAAMEANVTVKCAGATGVEMEALTAVSAALLTIYDMCKAVDRDMTISVIELVEKTGGRSGRWRRKQAEAGG